MFFCCVPFYPKSTILLLIECNHIRYIICHFTFLKAHPHQITSFVEFFRAQVASHGSEMCVNILWWVSISKAFYRVAVELCEAAQLCMFILGRGTFTSVYLSVYLGMGVALVTKNQNDFFFDVSRSLALQMFTKTAALSSCSAVCLSWVGSTLA